MELRQLKYFLQIVDHGSLSKAAQVLHIAQSALSRHVSELESELGVRLLHRRSSGVSASEAGKIFYEYALEITKQVANAKAAVLYSSDAIVGKVVVAIPQSVSGVLALPLLRAAASRYPHIAFHLNEELTGNIGDQIKRGRIDLAIFTNELSEDGVDFNPIVEEPFVFIHAADDPQAPSAEEISLARSLERPLLLPSSIHGHCARNVVERIVSEEGLPSPKIALEINSVTILKSAVEAGLGPSILPLSLARREVQDGRFVAHRIACPTMHRTLGLCVSSHVPMNNATAAISRLIEDVSNQLCAQDQWPGARPVREHQSAKNS